MRKVVTLKFDQNVRIRDRLLATTKPHYECSGDPTFGAGFRLRDSEKTDTSNLRGGNALGKILVQYRDSYIKNV